MRHLIAWAEGDQTEDHLAQAAWNCFTLMWTEAAVRRGELPAVIGDYGPLVDPSHVTNQKTGLSKEPGGEPIIPLRELVKCKVLVSKPCHEHGAASFSYVVVRRAGAVVMGWILSSHLTPKCPSPAADVEACIDTCTEHPWQGTCSMCGKNHLLTMALVHEHGAVCPECRKVG